jgi:hypothetical protein
MVSSLDLFAFSRRILFVIKGLRGRAGQLKVLRGACLSRIADKVELN